jgi:hypothetical protein
MTKIVLNRCYGGFSLSEEAVKLGRKLSKNPKWLYPCFIGEFWDSGEEIKYYYGAGRRLERDDDTLIKVVETLGKMASDRCAKLEIVEIPKGVLYRIDEYDGLESVQERDCTDWKVSE